MTIEEMDLLDLTKLTESQVVDAFTQHLRCEVRYMELDGETDACRETPEQTEERTDARYVFETMQLNYLASFVK